MKIKSLLIYIFFILLINSCQETHTPYQIKEIPEEFTCIINGGNYIDFEFNAINFPPPYASCIYYNNNLITILDILSTNEMSVLFSIYGNSYGKYQINENDSNRIHFYMSKDEYIEIKNGEINITSYGNVGENVEGTFSGTGIIVNDTLKETFVEIKNGKFKALRI